MAIKRRWLLVAVLVVSALIGAFVAYRPGLPPESRQYTVWLASTDILVDTADSQVVDAKGPDFLSLANRANLLGNLIATKPVKTAIADAVGLNPDRLDVVPPANTSATTTGGVALKPTPVTSAASRKIPDSEATVLTISTDANLPILRVAAQAPDASTASRLTTETSTQLARHLQTVGASEEIPAARRLVLRQLAEPTPAPETRGTPRTLGFVVAILIALLGSAAIVTAPILVRRWRMAEADSVPDSSAAEKATPPAPEVGPAVEEIGAAVPFDRAAAGRPARTPSRELATAAVASRRDAVADPSPAPAPRRKKPGGSRNGGPSPRDTVAEPSPSPASRRKKPRDGQNGAAADPSPGRASRRKKPRGGPKVVPSQPNANADPSAAPAPRRPATAQRRKKPRGGRNGGRAG